MGCTVSKAAARSRKIDEGLRADMRMREREVKLLLLGKSDLFFDVILTGNK